MQIVRVSTPDEAMKGELASLGTGPHRERRPRLHRRRSWPTPRRARWSTTRASTSRCSRTTWPRRASSSAPRRAAMARQRGAAAPACRAADAGPNDGTYRRLFDYSEELQQLAEDNPKLVKYKELKKHTYSDRPVESITVGKNVTKKDGRPAFLLTGAHHAPRVAVGRAHDRVRLRADQRLQRRQEADQEAPEEDAGHLRPGREPGRLQHLARGRRDRRRRGRPRRAGRRRDREPRDPVRVPPQELPRDPAVGATHSQLHGRSEPRPHPVRRRPEPQLRRLLGRPGRIGRGHPPLRLDRPGLPRPRARSRSRRRRTSASSSRRTR